MLQNFCFKFKLMENCDFFAVADDDCAGCAVVLFVAFVVRPSLLVSLAILGDDEIFLMLNAFFVVIFVVAFGNFALDMVALWFGVLAIDVTDTNDDFVWLFAMELVAPIVLLLLLLLLRLLLFMCDKLKFRSLFKITIELFAVLWLKLVELLLLLLFECLLDENVPNRASLLIRPLLLLWLQLPLKLLILVMFDIFFVIALSSSADSLELEHKLVYIICCLTSSSIMCFGSAITFSGTLYRLSAALLLLFDRHDFDGITLPAALAPSKLCWRFRRLLLRTYFKRPRKCLVPLFNSIVVRAEVDTGNCWISLIVFCIETTDFNVDLSANMLVFAPLQPPPLKLLLRLVHVRLVFKLKIGRITSIGNA